MTEALNTEPVEGDERDFTFTAIHGQTVTIEATYERTWRDEFEPCVGVDQAGAILDTWCAVDGEHRHCLWPSTERNDDDVFIAYVRDNRLTLDSWRVVTVTDRFSLDDLPALLPGDHYTLTQAAQKSEPQ